MQREVDGSLVVDDTPTDCVHLSRTGLADLKRDIVVSGINAGANLGDDTLYSGTVAAAMEGRHLGFAAIAVSTVSIQPQHFETAARVTLRLLEQIQRRSEEHTSELQSLMRISYAVFCLKKKKI